MTTRTRRPRRPAAPRPPRFQQPAPRDYSAEGLDPDTRQWKPLPAADAATLTTLIETYGWPRLEAVFVRYLFESF